MAEPAFSIAIGREASARDDFSRLQEFLKQIPDEFQAEAMDDALAEAAQAVVKRLKVPNTYFQDRTGRLRRSIRRGRRTKRGRRFTNIDVGNRKSRAQGGVFYAHFIESGTQNGIEPTRFLFRTIQESLSQFLNDVAQRVSTFGARKAVAKAKRKSGL